MPLNKIIIVEEKKKQCREKDETKSMDTILSEFYMQTPKIK